MLNIIHPNNKNVNSKRSFRLVFFGTPEFALAPLEALINSEFKPMVVVTAPDKPVGRKQIMTPQPVKILAEKYKIPVLQPAKLKDLDFIEKFKSLNPDLVFLTAYGKIIPKEILDIPRFGCLNAHPSLLPRHRGASPIQTTIMAGDQETGVTIFKMTERMDDGPIISQKNIKIEADETAEGLHKKLSALAAEMLISALKDWVAGKIKATAQDEKMATFTKIFKKKDGQISWQKTAQEIERQIRAFSPWPASFSRLTSDKMLKIIKAQKYSGNDSGLKPGQIFLTPDKKMAIKTKKDSLIIEKLQMEGKKPMSAQEFLNGHPEIIGEMLK